MKFGKRGFFSIDALFAITLLLIVSTTLINTHERRTELAEWIGTGEEAKMGCEKLASAINTVYSNGPDFELRVNLAPEIRGNDYTLSFDSNNRTVIAEVPDAKITSSARVTCKNVVLADLDPSKPVRVHWRENNVEVVNV